MRTLVWSVAVILSLDAVASNVARATTVTWFGPSAASNSNASMPSSTTYTDNFGVAFQTGSAASYSMDWLNIGLNTSSVSGGGSGSLVISLRDTTNTTPYSAAAGPTLLATDTISFSLPSSSNTNFTVSLNPTDFPNISGYAMSSSTAYSLMINGANPVIGLQRTTGYAQNTTNDFYTVNDGFVALNTFRNNLTYSVNPSNYPTLSIAFGTTAVPEPSATMLALAGLAGGFALRRLWRQV